MNGKKLKKKRNKLLFSPDDVVTKLSLAINRDLTTPLLAYKGLSEVQSFYMIAQISSTLKKYAHSDKDRQNELEQKTYAKFLSVNSHMATYRAMPLPVATRIQRSVSTRSRILLRAKAITKAILTPFTEEELFCECKNSHGVSRGVPFMDTSDESKFTFPLSCSELAYPLFQRYLKYDPVLLDAIEEFNCQHPTQSAIYVIENSSRATTVIKNDEIDRMIAIEQTVDMFLQQGLMHIFYNRLADYGLDLSKLPPLHQQLAMISSLTGKNATVDWTSASDCSALEYVRWLMPPKYLYVMECTRSRSIEIDGKDIELNMYSTMGNAVTFPLESIIFWTLMHAVHLENQSPCTNSHIIRDKSTCSIFGDDCILPVEDVSLFIETASSLGYMVNEKKSFVKHEGFRESCGGDYYRGYNVRPFYIKAPEQRTNSSLEPWLYTIMNKIIPKYIMYFGSLSYVYDKHVFRLLFDLFARLGKAVKLVPSYFPDDAGLKWSFDLQRVNACYKVSFAPISCDNQGLYSFQFCNFRYFEEQPKNDYLRYALWLRQPTITKWWIGRNFDAPKKKLVDTKRDRSAILSQADLLSVCDLLHWRKTKKKGGYVVAKGLASNWFVPTLN